MDRSKVAAARQFPVADSERRREPLGMFKAKQSAKIRELREALISAGLVTLDQQTKALGLSRSTTWAILRGDHKCSGLSAAIINRLLEASLPRTAKSKVLEYIDEKCAGVYGHRKSQINSFRSRVRGGLDHTLEDTRVG
jgi:hypothetical protein